MKTYRLIIRGFLGYIPGLLDFLKERKERTGTISARYCYSVWLRHLVLLEQNGMKTIPKTIAEIGPGASLGIGLSAMLSGVDSYFAFDIIRHTNSEINLKMLEDLILLFKQRSNIPDDLEFPKLYPKISSYEFPKQILSEDILRESLGDDRIAKIKEQLLNPLESNLTKGIQISYRVPWYDLQIIQPESIDLIISQAVLEHVIELEAAFKIMNLWLKKGGYISHEIDYKEHETHNIWNGHWFYSEFLWKVILKGRSYSINRQPHSTYVKIIKDCGFFNIQEIKSFDRTSYNTEKHKKRYPKYSEEDFLIKNALLQGVKY